MSGRPHVRAREGFRWEGVPVLAYKEQGALFRGVTRQQLFENGEALGVDLRYFEVEPGGHSTLERHEHEHLVLVLNGGGRALVGGELLTLATHDLVHVPPRAWHQFRASQGGPLGFLCLVRHDRDRPERPGEEDLRALRGDPAVADFIRT